MRWRKYELAHVERLIDEAVAYERERIAASLEAVEEFCKDYTLETGEVLIPRDVAAQVARLGGVPELLEES